MDPEYREHPHVGCAYERPERDRIPPNCPKRAVARALMRQPYLSSGFQGTEEYSPLCAEHLAYYRSLDAICLREGEGIIQFFTGRELHPLDAPPWVWDRTRTCRCGSPDQADHEERVRRGSYEHAYIGPAKATV